MYSNNSPVVVTPGPSVATTTPTVATTTTPVKPTPKPSPEPIPNPKPATYKNVIATVFWVGEASDAENGFIPNHESFWDSFWMEHFGGVDDPTHRCGYNPCKFTPKENPFYFALPYGDRDEDGKTKDSLKNIPWYKSFDPETTSLLKNTWIEVKYGSKICYAQWEDVGPFETDDFSYVFGNAKPKNPFGEKAGLDLSPATWDCLGMQDNDYTEWRFVKDSEVPPGPWQTTITTRGLSF